MLDTALKKVENLAHRTRFGRLTFAPHRYIYAQFIQQIWFPLTRRGVAAEAKTFFGTPLSMLLPSATDIYLAGGKTHDSEIRLAQFLLNTLGSPNANTPKLHTTHHTLHTQNFIDIGACVI